MLIYLRCESFTIRPPSSQPSLSLSCRMCSCIKFYSLWCVQAHHVNDRIHASKSKAQNRRGIRGLETLMDWCLSLGSFKNQRCIYSLFIIWMDMHREHQSQTRTRATTTVCYGQVMARRWADKGVTKWECRLSGQRSHCSFIIITIHLAEFGHFSKKKIHGARIYNLFQGININKAIKKYYSM